MQIICVDDHPVLLEGLVNTVKRILKNANVQGFTKAEEAFVFAKQTFSFLPIDQSVHRC